MDDYLHIKKTVINIGLKREYKFFQISDAHIMVKDEQSSQNDIEKYKIRREKWDILKKEFADKYGDVCDERYDTEPTVPFERLAQYAKDIGSDALILSGDILDIVSESNLRYIKSFLEGYNHPYIYCLGNHESYDEFDNKCKCYDRLKPVIKNPDFLSVDYGEFKIVSLDNGMKQVSEEQLKKLEKELLGDKRIILVIHEPLSLGEFGEKAGKIMSPYFLYGSEKDPDDTKRLLDLVVNNEEKFIAVLAGHVHTTVEEKITDKLMQYTITSALIGYGREIIIR
ncbi:MAG: metallophosphoesterase [Clostridia bacterium]|nr:metallophosphoesterase [Clostridia bacterium]